MFRVPRDAATPTYDETFKVSFWRWLTSGKDERQEWMRRRNAAMALTKANVDSAAAQAQAAYDEAKAQGRSEIEADRARGAAWKAARRKG